MKEDACLNQFSWKRARCRYNLVSASFLCFEFDGGNPVPSNVRLSIGQSHHECFCHLLFHFLSQLVHSNLIRKETTTKSLQDVVQFYLLLVLRQQILKHMFGNMSCHVYHSLTREAPYRTTISLS